MITAEINTNNITIHKYTIYIYIYIYIYCSGAPARQG